MQDWRGMVEEYSFSTLGSSRGGEIMNLSPDVRLIDRFSTLGSSRGGEIFEPMPDDYEFLRFSTLGSSRGGEI